MNNFKLVLNGRFLGRPVTGVERLAIELSNAVCALLAELKVDVPFEIAAPQDTTTDTARPEAAGLASLPVRIVGRLGGHAWEQVELSRFNPSAWLLNLCNTAPVVRRRQAVVICDAQFILHPKSYSRAFRWWYRLSLSLASRRSAAVFTISAFSKHQLERYGVIPARKAQILTLGVDHLRAIVPDPGVLERHRLGERPYVLATGSLARHKNLAMLIDAFIDADVNGVDLVIVGGGNTRVFGSAGFRTGDNVRFLGRVSDGELRALYQSALAFACPSLSEGFGFTPLEAMTAGCPVIATTGGAVPEVCGDAALYADPHVPAEWIKALRTMVDNASLRADLVRRGHERAERYRWRDTAAQLLAVLAAYDGRSTLAARFTRIAERRDDDFPAGTNGDATSVSGS